VSFKRPQVSPVGGRLTRGKQHPPNKLYINAAFYAHGTINTCSASFLLDTGAAMSVIHREAVPDCYQNQIKPVVNSGVVGANGLPLDIIGTVNIPITLGTFARADFLSSKTPLELVLQLLPDFTWIFRITDQVEQRWLD
jgi:hypothetical protein